MHFDREPLRLQRLGHAVVGAAVLGTRGESLGEARAGLVQFPLAEVERAQPHQHVGPSRMRGAQRLVAAARLVRLACGQQRVGLAQRLGSGASANAAA